MSRARPRSTADVRAFAIEAARLCADRKCEDVIVIDVRERSQVCDYIVVATGTSERQMRTVAHEVGELGEGLDQRAWRSSADDGGTWIVIDCVHVVVHLFEPEQRGYYDLEALWDGAPRIPWRRTPGSAPAPAAAEPKPTARRPRRA